MNRESAGYLLLMIAPFVFGAMWLSSAIIDGKWVFGVDTLSYLGISEDPLAAALFNWGCIIMGASLVICGLLLFRTESKILDIRCILTIIGGFMLAGVGIFTLDTGDPHNFSSMCFAAMIFGTMILSIYTDHETERPYCIFTISLIVLCVAMLLGMVIRSSTFGLPQATLIISALVWSFSQGLKYFCPYGKMKTRSVRE